MRLSVWSAQVPIDVTGKLKEQGFDVKGMGKPLTEYLKSGKKVLTFQRMQLAAINSLYLQAMVRYKQK